MITTASPRPRTLGYTFLTSRLRVRLQVRVGTGLLVSLSGGRLRLRV